MKAAAFLLGAALLQQAPAPEQTPTQAELLRFPPPKQVEAMLDWLAEARAIADNVRVLYPWRADEWNRRFHRLDCLDDDWRALRRVHYPWQGEAERRGYLELLRERIGDDAYYSGHMPLPEQFRDE